MLNKISYKLSSIVANNTGVDEETREVYQYAFELILTTIIGFAAILAIAMLSIGIEYGIIFLIFFSSLRTVAGGYHADSYLKCFCVSCVMFVGVVIAYRILLSLDIRAGWLTIIAVVSGIYIILRAPVLHRNQPLNERKIQKNKQMAKIIVITELAVICLLAMVRIDLMIMAIISICLVTLLMLPSDRKIRGRRSIK